LSKGQIFSDGIDQTARAETDFKVVACCPPPTPLHEADIAKVEEWLGHSNVSTTQLHDRRKCARKTARIPGE
jgi:hypothetical protein